MLPWVDVTEKPVYFIEGCPVFAWTEYFTGQLRIPVSVRCSRLLEKITTFSGQCVTIVVLVALVPSDQHGCCRILRTTCALCLFVCRAVCALALHLRVWS
jgi:hypothetical protein